MAINALWNKRYGPGGSARRLHHFFPETFKFLGPLWGRNRIDVRSKDIAFVRHGTTVIGLNFTNANDNEAFAVAA